MANILLVDDEANVREVLSLSLSSYGHDVTTSANIEDATSEMNTQNFEVIITDLRMNDKNDGIEVVSIANQLQPDASILLLTAYASAETAVEAMRNGAFDYITKPVSRTELGEIVERALNARTNNPKHTLNEQVNNDEQRGSLIGESHVIQRVRERIQRAAQRDFTVLITGESGTGKELAARLVHESSPRASSPFVPVHCGAIPENLFESELFGYIKGAFTGADTDKTGLIESAAGGTLFLDEIGEMPLLIQVKLLRVLQDMKVRRVGSESEHQVDVRIVTATNRDLEAEVKAGNFREDLFYRLNVIPVHMPALRQRREDIPMLVESLMKRHGGANITISDACLKRLSSLPLAGNVRELENTLQRLLALSDDGEMDIDLLDEFQTVSNQGQVTLDDMQKQGLSLDEQLENLERNLVKEALSKTKGNATKAAKLLGIGFRSIRYRLEKLGMKEPKD
ncbi:MAG: sigma-54 dependent transcriptional regulator [Ghiorsea sp.]